MAELLKTILLTLMVIGACAGSTGGGLKCARVLLLFKIYAETFTRYFTREEFRLYT